MLLDIDRYGDGILFGVFNRPCGISHPARGHSVIKTFETMASGDSVQNGRIFGDNIHRNNAAPVLLQQREKLFDHIGGLFEGSPEVFGVFVPSTFLRILSQYSQHGGVVGVGFDEVV